MQWLSFWFDAAQQWLFESVFQPVMFAVGLANLLEDGYAATGWLLVGLLQLAVMLIVIAPLERWRPIEAVTDRAAVRTDVVYTLVHRLGVFRLVLFLAIDPLWDALFGHLRMLGISTWHLDGIWPGVTDQPLLSLLLYLLIFDFLDYAIHRGQHRFDWWWKLHSLHHSQRQMTMWSDNRNHLLDDLIRDTLVVLVAQCIGVAPAQFVAIVAITQLSENFHHANARIWFGHWGERLWISPRFHRKHHAIGLPLPEGMPQPAPQTPRMQAARGCNFGVLSPWWDMVFRTANFDARLGPTGVDDQVIPGPDGKVRDYGRGFWAQQWRGVLRLTGRA